MYSAAAGRFGIGAQRSKARVSAPIIRRINISSRDMSYTTYGKVTITVTRPAVNSNVTQQVTKSWAAHEQISATPEAWLKLRDNRWRPWTNSIEYPDKRDWVQD